MSIFEKLNTIEILISKAFFDSFVGQDKFVSANNVLREYNEIKKETKNPESSVEHNLSYGWCKQRNAWKNDIEAITDNDGILWLQVQ